MIGSFSLKLILAWIVFHFEALAIVFYFIGINLIVTEFIYYVIKKQKWCSFPFCRQSGQVFQSFLTHCWHIFFCKFWETFLHETTCTHVVKKYRWMRHSLGLDSVECLLTMNRRTSLVFHVTAASAMTLVARTCRWILFYFLQCLGFIRITSSSFFYSRF